MTFSIAARCAHTGMVGAAVCSSSIAVASRCAHVRAQVGAVLTQNITDPALGPMALSLIERGLTVDEVLAQLQREQASFAWRQVVLMPARGRALVFSGEKTLGIAGEAIGAESAAAGNLLANPRVPAAMVEAFEREPGHLAGRLVRALLAGLAAGGEMGPVHAAGVIVADRLSWPSVDLRVDWSDRPVEDLRGLWDWYEPQLEAYVERASSPQTAERFGVAGESRAPDGSV